MHLLSRAFRSLRFRTSNAARQTLSSITAALLSHRLKREIPLNRDSAQMLRRRKQECAGSNLVLFPQHVRYAGALRLHLRGSGFKDKVYTHLSTTVSWCLQHNYTLVWDGDLGFYGNWCDWFPKFWSLSNSPDCLSTIEYVPNWASMPLIGLEILGNHPPVLINELWSLLQPQKARVQSTQQMLGLTECCYGAVQVRRGDKITTGQLQTVSAESIAAALPRSVGKLFVATDDFSVVTELRTLLSVPVTTLCPSENRGSFGEYDRWQDTEPRRHTEVARLIFELEICRLAEYFIQVVPRNRAGSLGVGRNYQISDMIADLRFRRRCIRVS
jgi:hypothetical protein